MSLVQNSRIQVCIPSGLEDVVPPYLESKRRELPLYFKWVAERNFSEIEKASHKLKGSAGGYGFEVLGLIAGDLNNAAKSHDFSLVESLVQKLEEHLERVELVEEGA